jgi:hypothetical protein
MGGMSDFMSEIFSTAKGAGSASKNALFDSIGNAFWK